MQAQVRRLRRLARKALVAWGAGLLPALPWLAMRLAGQIRVRGREHLKQNCGYAIVSNHVGIWEVMLIPLCAFPRGLWNFRMVPINIAAVENFKRWWWRWASPFMIFVSRRSGNEAGNGTSGALSLLGIAKRVAAIILRRAGVVLLFLEGGRTMKLGKGERYRYSPTLHKRIRPFKRLTVQVLLQHACRPVMFVPVWVEARDDIRVKIKGWVGKWPCGGYGIRFGPPVLIPPDTPIDEVIKILEDAVLALADQE